MIGNQFGGGRGKTAATIVGTLLGVSVAREIGKHSVRKHASYERHCRTVERYRTEERTEGYWVT